MPVGIEISRVNVTDDDAEPHGDLTYKITGNKQQILLMHMYVLLLLHIHKNAI